MKAAAMPIIRRAPENNAATLVVLSTDLNAPARADVSTQIGCGIFGNCESLVVGIVFLQGIGTRLWKLPTFSVRMEGVFVPF